MNKLERYLDIMPGVLWRRGKEVCITGSMVLALNNIISMDEVKDLDLLVSPSLWDYLINEVGFEPNNEYDDKFLIKLVSPVRNSTDFSFLQIDILNRLTGLDVDDVFNNSTTVFLAYTPFRVQSLRDFRIMKQAVGRPKDLAHLELLKERS